MKKEKEKELDAYQQAYERRAYLDHMIAGNEALRDSMDNQELRNSTECTFRP